MPAGRLRMICCRPKTRRKTIPPRTPAAEICRCVVAQRAYELARRRRLGPAGAGDERRGCVSVTFPTPYRPRPTQKRSASPPPVPSGAARRAITAPAAPTAGSCRRSTSQASLKAATSPARSTSGATRSRVAWSRGADRRAGKALGRQSDKAGGDGVPGLEAGDEARGMGRCTLLEDCVERPRARSRRRGCASG